MLLHTHARVWVSVCSWLVSNHSKIPAFIYSAYSGFVRTLVAFVMKYCVLWCWQVNIPLSFPHLVFVLSRNFRATIIVINLKCFVITSFHINCYRDWVIKLNKLHKFQLVPAHKVNKRSYLLPNKKSITFGWCQICVLIVIRKKMERNSVYT